MRARLLMPALALLASAVLVILLSSPYAAVIEPLRPIEEIWDLEDTRQESDGVLVKSLQRDGVPLGYDEERNTFYCPIPLESEEWPSFSLESPGVPGLRMCFADDYLYDSPADAMAGGVAYRVFAYTEKEFSYFNLVFTGIPQVCLFGEESLFGDDDVPVRAAVTSGDRSVFYDARTHYRGGVTRGSPKHNYRLEFTRKSNGKKKTAREVPGIGDRVQNLILIPMVYDRTLMRDRLSWDVYADSLPENEPFGKRAMQYIELFVNDSYQGVYLMLEPFDYTQELLLAGEKHVETDSVYRVGIQRRKPWTDGAYFPGRGFTLYYAPPGAGDPFEGLSDYKDLIRETSDEAFWQKAMEQLDLPSMIRHMLLVQGGGYTDNVLNNLYVWADRTGGKTVYRFFPWDMDATWGDREDKIGPEFDYWIYFPTLDRLIDLDTEGEIRALVQSEWQRLRAHTLSESFIEERLLQYVHELNDSGAAQRNGEAWGLGVWLADPESILTFISVRFPLIDQAVEAIGKAKGRIEWLQYTDYENKSRQMNRGWFTLPGGEAGEETP